MHLYDCHDYVHMYPAALTACAAQPHNAMGIFERQNHNNHLLTSARVRYMFCSDIYHPDIVCQLSRGVRNRSVQRNMVLSFLGGNSCAGTPQVQDYRKQKLWKYRVELSRAKERQLQLKKYV